MQFLVWLAEAGPDLRSNRANKGQRATIKANNEKKQQKKIMHLLALITTRIEEKMRAGQEV